MLPVVEGDGKGTSHRIVATTVALLGASFLPLVFQSAGLVYGVSAGVLGTGLLGLGFLFLARSHIASGPPTLFSVGGLFACSLGGFGV